MDQLFLIVALRTPWVFPRHMPTQLSSSREALVTKLALEAFPYLNLILFMVDEFVKSNPYPSHFIQNLHKLAFLFGAVEFGVTSVRFIPFVRGMMLLPLLRRIKIKFTVEQGAIIFDFPDEFSLLSLKLVKTFLKLRQGFLLTRTALLNF